MMHYLVSYRIVVPPAAVLVIQLPLHACLSLAENSVGKSAMGCTYADAEAAALITTGTAAALVAFDAAHMLFRIPFRDCCGCYYYLGINGFPVVAMPNFVWLRAAAWRARYDMTA